MKNENCTKNVCKKRWSMVFLMCLATTMYVGDIVVAAQPQIGTADGTLATKWAQEVVEDNVLPEYPRPQLQRGSWKNLNGQWDYAIKHVGGSQPDSYDGKILVPFAVESALSGVQKTVGGDNELWYHRTFTVPSKWKNSEIMLNFGAVDWRADVFVNGSHAGSHEGGYTPFSINITPYLNKRGEQDLVVRVYDATDYSFQPCGKQAVKPGKITYTAVTGIWQTVWIEPVNADHIRNLRMSSDIKSGRLRLSTDVEGGNGMKVVAKIIDGDKVVATAIGAVGDQLTLLLDKPRLWSPDSPHLYDVEVSLVNAKGKTVDNVKSYTAFREIGKARDDDGIMRFTLNGEKIFMFGPLDQGWWPDGLYTAPTDEALRFDIEKTKQWGFNMIRKHVKVEPARWYYHCDRIGLLVWQDMPSGDKGDYTDRVTNQRQERNKWVQREYGTGTDRQRSAESKANFYREWGEVMDFCHNFPCVVVWVPFNEAWGQFDTPAVSEWTKKRDPSRLVNPASGGNFYTVGDMMDMHHYPDPGRFYLFDPMRVNVLGEYGGIGLPVEGHTWNGSGAWGYVRFKTGAEVTDTYVKYARELMTLARRGYSGAVYTQTTDVEGEVNGIMAYDRKVVKMDESRIAAINKEVVGVVK